MKIFTLAMCFAGGLFLSPALTGQVILAPGKTTDAIFFGDDYHRSATRDLTWVSPFAVESMFQKAVANQDFTPEKGWNFHYHGSDGLALIQDITVEHYEPWAVYPPFPSPPYDPPGEVAGAGLQATYHPTAPTDPMGTSWIQVISSFPHEGEFKPLFDPYVDNLGASTPFYPIGRDYTFRDTPDRHEFESVLNPTAVWHGQAFLVRDLQTQLPEGPVIHDIDVYGALDWGFTYTTVETPEPSTYSLAGLGVLALAILVRRKAQRR